MTCTIYFQECGWVLIAQLTPHQKVMVQWRFVQSPLLAVPHHLRLVWLHQKVIQLVPEVWMWNNFFLLSTDKADEYTNCFFGFFFDADGMDFVATTRMINFEASLNPSRVCTTFDILNDELAMEGDESFSISLQLPPGSDSDLLEAAVIITDDEDGREYYVSSLSYVS